MLGTAKQGWIGVDLGERAIKVVQLHRSGDRLRLESAAVCPRHAEGASTFVDDLRSARALSEHLRGSHAAATLSMQASCLEPTDEETVIAAGHCADQWSAGPNSSYTLSVSTERIDAAVDGLARIGLNCEVIDGPPLAIARVLQLSPGYQPDKLLAALDWGESTATFLAAKGGQAIYVRQLKASGFSEVRERVGEALGLSPADAGRAIARHGVGRTPAAAPEARVVGDAMRTTLRPLMDELRRTLEHLGGKLKSRGPERTYMMGVAGTVAGLPELLGEAIQQPVEAWTAAGVDRGPASGDAPDCLLAQAIALSALAWEARV